MLVISHQLTLPPALRRVVIHLDVLTLVTATLPEICNGRVDKVTCTTPLQLLVFHQSQLLLQQLAPLVEQFMLDLHHTQHQELLIALLAEVQYLFPDLHRILPFKQVQSQVVLNVVVLRLDKLLQKHFRQLVLQLPQLKRPILRRIL